MSCEPGLGLIEALASGLVGAPGSFLAYQRSLVLVSRFESSLEPWPPTAPTSPLASVPWQHLGRGVEKQKQGPLSAQLPLPLGSARSTVHRGLQQVLFSLGPLTNPRTTWLLVLSHKHSAKCFPPGGPEHFPKDPSHPSLLAAANSDVSRPDEDEEDGHRSRMDTSCPLCPALGFVHVGPLESQTCHCLRSETGVEDVSGVISSTLFLRPLELEMGCASDSH